MRWAAVVESRDNAWRAGGGVGCELGAPISKLRHRCAGFCGGRFCHAAVRGSLGLRWRRRLRLRPRSPRAWGALVATRSGAPNLAQRRRRELIFRPPAAGSRGGRGLAHADEELGAALAKARCAADAVRAPQQGQPRHQMEQPTMKSVQSAATKDGLGGLESGNCMRPSRRRDYPRARNRSMLSSRKSATPARTTARRACPSS